MVWVLRQLHALKAAHASSCRQHACGRGRKEAGLQGLMVVLVQSANVVFLIDACWAVLCKGLQRDSQSHAPRSHQPVGDHEACGHPEVIRWHASATNYSTLAKVLCAAARVKPLVRISQLVIMKPAGTHKPVYQSGGQCRQ